MDVLLYQYKCYKTKNRTKSVRCCVKFNSNLFYFLGNGIPSAKSLPRIVIFQDVSS